MDATVAAHAETSAGHHRSRVRRAASGSGVDEPGGRPASRVKRWAIGLALGVATAVVAGTAPTLQREAQAEPTCAPRWRVVADTGFDYAWGIAARSPRDVWVVGYDKRWDSSTAEGVSDSAAIAHWDGRVVRNFHPFGARTGRSSILTGVAAVAGDDVWAVGDSGPSTYRGSERSPRVVHWDGRSWRNVALPRLNKTAYLADVVALSASDVWAVGGIGYLDTKLPLALHWDGHAWKRFKLGSFGEALWSIDAASPRDIWAVGASGINSSHTENWGGYGAHWDGRRWHELPKFEGEEEFFAVSAISEREVWMVGWHPGAGWGYLMRVGRAPQVNERQPRTIFKSRGALSDVAVAGRNDVWAVGKEREGGDRVLPLVAHWNGTRVTERTPFGARAGALGAVTALSKTDVWAAGDHLIARYSC